MNQRNNSGILFKNDRKQKDTHPDYQGECMVDGKPHKMSAWLKDGKKGKFMSFSFTAIDAEAVALRPENVAKPKDDDMDNDIPF